MERKDRKKKKFPHFAAPGLRCRLLVYAAALFLAALSGIQLAEECFSGWLELAVYGSAGALFFLSCCFAWTDIRFLKQKLAAFLDSLKEKYRFIRRFLTDSRYRTFFITGLGLLLNLAFAVFNGAVGFMAVSPWYITLAVYYAALGIMRFWAVNYERRLEWKGDARADSRRLASRERLPGGKAAVCPETGKTRAAGHRPRQRRKIVTQPETGCTDALLQKKEIRLYRNTSIGVILLTIVLSGMVILVADELGGRHYPGTLIYVMALYTFVKVPLAVRNWLQAKKEKTLIFVTVRSIAFADACVSVLSLQTAMFSSFGAEAGEYEKMMDSVTGAVVCLLVLGMGIYGVVSAGRLQKGGQGR